MPGLHILCHSEHMILLINTGSPCCHTTPRNCVEESTVSAHRRRSKVSRPTPWQWHRPGPPYLSESTACIAKLFNCFSYTVVLSCIRSMVNSRNLHVLKCAICSPHFSSGTRQVRRCSLVLTENSACIGTLENVVHMCCSISAMLAPYIRPSVRSICIRCVPHLDSGTSQIRQHPQGVGLPIGGGPWFHLLPQHPHRRPAPRLRHLPALPTRLPDSDDCRGSCDKIRPMQSGLCSLTYVPPAPPPLRSLSPVAPACAPTLINRLR